LCALLGLGGFAGRGRVFQIRRQRDGFRWECRLVGIYVDPRRSIRARIQRRQGTHDLYEGAHKIVPGLETAMEDMKKGERKHVVVTPTDGYGPIDPQAIREVKEELFSAAAQKVGTQLQGQAANGSTAFPIVKEIKEETVVLDSNHPLAGKPLHFDVTFLAITAGSL
jgi:FKBP-type peptidyl-prolyl cis-trans isomerase 2